LRRFISLGPIDSAFESSDDSEFALPKKNLSRESSRGIDSRGWSHLSTDALIARNDLKLPVDRPVE
jgi:hypothetical protein